MRNLGQGKNLMVLALALTIDWAIVYVMMTQSISIPFLLILVCPVNLHQREMITSMYLGSNSIP